MAEALTTGEFERWSESDRLFKERILDHVEAQAMKNTAYETEIAVLKASGARAATKNGILSAVIAGFVSGAGSYFGGK